jgi:hypothetical protein
VCGGNCMSLGNDMYAVGALKGYWIDCLFSDATFHFFYLSYLLSSTFIFLVLYIEDGGNMLPKMLYPSFYLWASNAQRHRSNLNTDHCEHHSPYVVNTFHNYGLLIFLFHSDLSIFFNASFGHYHGPCMSIVSHNYLGLHTIGYS